MTENSANIRQDKTFKEKLINFYKEKKILIYSIIISIIVIIISFALYFDSKERNKLLLSENYIEAKVLLESGERDRAKIILEAIVNNNDKTYSTLALFLILNENLITDQNDLLNLFNHILENNKFDEETKNLILFKKMLFQSNFASEVDLIEASRQLINEDSVWKPHALMLMGDYFLSKNENAKARDYYNQILELNNLVGTKEFYDHAKFKLRNIENE